MYFSLNALTNDDRTMHRRMQMLSSQMSPSHSPRQKRNTLYYTKTHCNNMEYGLHVSFITVRPHNNIEILHCQIYNILHNCLYDLKLYYSVSLRLMFIAFSTS
jgi:hypothetical protein